MIGYALMAPAGPFPVFVLGFVFNGFGISLQVGIMPTRLCLYVHLD